MRNPHEELTLQVVRRTPQKSLKVTTEDGRNMTINSYMVGPFGEYVAVSQEADKDRWIGGTRIVPLQYVQRAFGGC